MGPRCGVYLSGPIAVRPSGLGSDRFGAPISGDGPQRCASAGTASIWSIWTGAIGPAVPAIAAEAAPTDQCISEEYAFAHSSARRY